MKFNIVLPTYNRAFCIETAIRSIIRQDYHDWQLTIIDNCSTDMTRDVCLPFTSNPCVKYVRYDQFVSAADNWGRALQHLAGDYTLLIGDDDALTDRCLSGILKIAQQTDADIILSDAAIYLFRNRTEGIKHSLLIPRNQATTITSRDPIELAHCYLSCFYRNMDGRQIHPSVVFVKSALLKKVSDVYGTVYFGLFPDWGAHPLLGVEARRLVTTDEPLVLIGAVDSKYYCRNNSKFPYFGLSQSGDVICGPRTRQDLATFVKLASDFRMTPFMFATCMRQELMVLELLERNNPAAYERVRPFLLDNLNGIIDYLLGRLRENYAFCEKCGDPSDSDLEAALDYRSQRQNGTAVQSLKRVVKTALFRMPTPLLQTVLQIRNSVGTSGPYLWTYIPSGQMDDALACLNGSN